jgi:hypothetical protein
MMQIVNDTIIMDDGTKYQANCGIIGIGMDDEFGLTLHEGYDGGLEVAPRHRAELADYMIAQWQAFKDSQTS